MESSNKKTPGPSNGLQRFSRQAPHSAQTKLINQVKANVLSQSVKRPSAPPVYHPQPVPKVLQTKNSRAPQASAGPAPHRSLTPRANALDDMPPAVQRKIGIGAGLRKAPAAPQAYSPQPVPKVLQTMASVASLSQRQSKPSATVRTPFRPQPSSVVLQRKTVPGSSRPADAARRQVNVVSRNQQQKPAMSAPHKAASAPLQLRVHPYSLARHGGVIQRMEASLPSCPIHAEIALMDGICWQCEIDEQKKPQKADQPKKKKPEIVVTMEEWCSEYSKIAPGYFNKMESNIIIHRGNTPPSTVDNPVARDLINHETSGAPVWFTIGKSTTGNAIEGYKYHHVLVLNQKVSSIIKGNLTRTINHSEGVSGESNWTGYMVKTNEPGCFAVSLNMLDAFYGQYKTSHSVEVKK